MENKKNTHTQTSQEVHDTTSNAPQPGTPPPVSVVFKERQPVELHLASFT